MKKISLVFYLSSRLREKKLKNNASSVQNHSLSNCSKLAMWYTLFHYKTHNILILYFVNKGMCMHTKLKQNVLIVNLGSETKLSERNDFREIQNIQEGLST